MKALLETRRYEEVCKELLEFAPDPMVVINRDGVFVLANNQALTVFGYHADELLGKPVEVIVPERLRPQWNERIGGAESCDGVGPRGGDASFVGLRKDGSEFPLELTLGKVRVDQTVLTMLAMRDFTERRRIEDELNARVRQQALVAQLGRQALTGIDFHSLMSEAADLMASELKVEFTSVLELLNDGSLLLQAGSGWRGGLVGRPVSQSTSAAPAAQVLSTLAPIVVEDLSKDHRFPDVSYLREHGIVSSLSVPLYGHDRPFGVLGAHTPRPRRFSPEDVHFVQSVANILSAAIERKWYEQQQHDKQLSRAEQMMAIGQVAAGVAHELRNPLTSIKGLVQVNMRETEEREMREDLSVIEHEIRRMERTLQTFLDFARPPEPHRESMCLTSVVERVSELVKGRAKKQQVVLKCIKPAESFWLEADQDQLQQLLLNLVLNALDAMPQGGVIEIDLRPPRDRHIELHVRDTGPGIAPHILPKLFETFVSGKETGIGLGLPVSKRIAEDHGGTLTAYNLPEGGACFVIRLPAPIPE